MVTPRDITVAPAPAGGWMVIAKVWLANETPAALEMGCVLTLSLNGDTLTSHAQAVTVTGSVAGRTSRASSCVTDVACAAYRPSIIVPGTCYCCNHSISVEFAVPSLAPGDVLAAYAVPLPGSAEEIATGNDGAVSVVPVPGGHNRAVHPGDIHYSAPRAAPTRRRARLSFARGSTAPAGICRTRSACSSTASRGLVVAAAARAQCASSRSAPSR
ncbi:MAG: hypothetical protein Q8L55_07065 [Phycisphaerales bacterium]|nr:hypothetical protein [Phycisphaerales bacterium]